MVIVRNIPAEDLQYFNENWSNFLDMENIVVNEGYSLETIRFNLGVVAHFDQILALIETEFDDWFNNALAEMLEKNHNRDKQSIMCDIISDENKIQNDQAKKNILELQLLNQEDQLKELYKLHGLSAEEFDLIKDDFITNYKNADAKYLSPVLKYIQMILWISYFQRRIVMTKLDLIINEKNIESVNITLQANKQKVEEINKKHFEKIINLTQKVSSEECKKSLKTLEEINAKIMENESKFLNDLTLNKKSLEQIENKHYDHGLEDMFQQGQDTSKKNRLLNENIELCAKLRTAENDKINYEKIINETKKIIEQKARAEKAESFENYCNRLGYS